MQQAIIQQQNLPQQVVDRPQQLPTLHQDHDLPCNGTPADGFLQPFLALYAGKHTGTAPPSDVQFLCSTPDGKVPSTGFMFHSIQNSSFQRYS